MASSTERRAASSTACHLPFAWATFCLEVLMTPPNFDDLTNRKFNDLTVISRAPSSKRGHARWNCRCICGNIITTMGTHLKTNHTKSCASCSLERSRERATIHGASYTTEHNAWCSMKGRCNNPNNPAYHNYGGRGIKVCGAWNNSFKTFLADMGLKTTLPFR